MFDAGVFAQTEAIISIIILLLIAAMIWLRNNFRAFMLAQWIMLAGFILALFSTWSYLQHQLGMYHWMLLTGLGLYMVYIPFNSILFDRFIAAYRFAGNVGFLIYIADAFGYLGSVGVMLAKTVFRIQANWLDFYTQLVIVSGVAGLLGTIASMFYFVGKKTGIRR